MTDSADTLHQHIDTTADIVAAYVSRNSVPASDLPSLIRSVHESLLKLGTTPAVEAPVELKPAVSIKKSITDDYLISLESGKKFRSLKRHLATEYGMTPDEYRTKWGLPKDYPMVAPSYAKARSELAKTMGLGRKATDEVMPEDEPMNVEAAPAEAPKKPRKHAAKTD